MPDPQPSSQLQPALARPPARWVNPWRWVVRARWAVQLAYVAFLVAVAFRFAAFVAAALGDGPIAVARPPAVEAFLPIAALVATKRLLLTGAWDEIHPAGLTIFLAAIATALLARKAFCSWVCPVGTLSRGLEWVGTRTLWRRGYPAVPRRLDVALASVKYLLLAFFLGTVLTMPLDGILEFMRGPYNLAADAKMLGFFRDLSITGGAVLGALALLSLGVKHLWCRYLCPYGALLGVVSFLSPLFVRRDPETCNDCRACTRACPVEIPVHARLRVLTPECTGCMSCVAACTVPDCLGVTRVGALAWPAWLVPAVALATMLGAWIVARATGSWETTVAPALFRWAYRIMGAG
ncbi:MAG: 4Fe-4S binding protein [Anaeromyxobacteraceae bacterium]